MAAQQQKKSRRKPQRPAAPMPAPTAPTAASDWVTRTPSADAETLLPLPSGNVARVRPVAPEAFLEQGLIPDPLTAVVDKAIRSKKGMRPQQLKPLTEQPEQLGAMLEMMDRVTVYAVLEPKVVMPPACTECNELNTARAKQHSDESRDDYHKFTPKAREDGVLYVDRVDMDDKSFIMQWAMGGTRDLEQFRRQHRAAVAGLSA